MKHQHPDRDDARLPASSSLWLATAPAGPALPVVAGDVQADTLVIGGGIAGTTTALHLAEAGVDVVLLEAGQVGDGASGQSGGVIAPDFIRHTPETLGRVIGRQAATRLTRMIGGSARDVFGLIERHAIDCDAYQDGFFTPAHTEGLAENQRRYANQWHSRGYDVNFVEADEARAIFGADRYRGALRFGDGGRLNPLAYARGLARAAGQQGARLFAGSPVIALTREPGCWRAQTPGGMVTARRLVLAANGGNAALHPALRRTALPLNVMQFASAPLSPAQRLKIMPMGGAFTDKVPYLFTARLDGAGHLVSAFAASFLVRGEKAGVREAERRLKQHFATMPDPRIAYLWPGTAWVNPSLLPEVYELGDDGFAIQADNGRGITVNTAIGIELAAMLARSDRDAMSVPMRAPKPIRFHRTATLVPKLLMSMAYLSN